MAQNDAAELTDDYAERARQAYDYFKRGLAARDAGDVVEACDLLDRCLEIREELAASNSAYEAQAALSDVYLELGSVEGEHNYYRCLDLRKRLVDEFDLPEARLALADLYLLLSSPQITILNASESEAYLLECMKTRAYLACELDTPEAWNDFGTVFRQLRERAVEAGNLNAERQVWESYLSECLRAAARLGADRVGTNLQKAFVYYAAEARDKSSLVSMEDLLETCDDLCKTALDDSPDLCLALARALYDLGERQRVAGDLASAGDLFDLSLRLWESVLRKDDSQQVRLERLHALVAVAQARWERANVQAAEEAYHEASAEAAQLAGMTGDSGARLVCAVAFLGQGRVRLSCGDASGAVAAFTQASKLAGFLTSQEASADAPLVQAQALCGLAEARWEAGDKPGAAEAVEQIQEVLSAAQQKSLLGKDTYEVARVRSCLLLLQAMAQEAAGQLEAADELYQQCVNFEEALKKTLRSPAAAASLAKALSGLVGLRMSKHDLDAAVGLCEECVNLRRDLLDFLQTADAKRQLADALYQRGTLRKARGSARAAQKDFSECLDLRSELFKDRDDPEARGELADILFQAAIVSGTSIDLPLLQQCLALRQKTLEEDGSAEALRDVFEALYMASLITGDENDLWRCLDLRMELDGTPLANKVAPGTGVVLARIGSQALASRDQQRIRHFWECYLSLRDRQTGQLERVVARRRIAAVLYDIGYDQRDLDRTFASECLAESKRLVEGLVSSEADARDVLLLARVLKTQAEVCLHEFSRVEEAKQILLAIVQLNADTPGAFADASGKNVLADTYLRLADLAYQHSENAMSDDYARQALDQLRGMETSTDVHTRLISATAKAQRFCALNAQQKGSEALVFLKEAEEEYDTVESLLISTRGFREYWVEYCNLVRLLGNGGYVDKKARTYQRRRDKMQRQYMR